MSATLPGSAPRNAAPDDATSPEPRPRVWNERIAIALIAATALLFEVGITRVLSVVLWYHFAFLAISLAMLGLGVPGVWYALRGVGEKSLERSMLAAAALVPLSLVVLIKLGEWVEFRTALATLCVAVPMLALGSAVCLLLLRARGRAIGAMYAADLIGATAGTLLIVPLMHVIPTPLLLAGAAVLPLLALFLVGRAYRRAAIVAGILLVTAMAWGEPFRLHYTKGYSERTLKVLVEEWTPNARLTVLPTLFWLHTPKLGFGWGLGWNAALPPADQVWLEQDGSAGTPITRLTGSPHQLDYLFDDVTSAPYEWLHPRNVCVIGAGGGRDILAALAAGASRVTAVELNSHIIRLVSGRFGAYSGDIYHRPGVQAVAGEGRSFLTHTRDRYDMIQISLIDSWAATTAGAFALSENYLYTIEAYRLYWNRLAPGGVVSTSRWMSGVNRLEAIRLAYLVRKALELEGVEEPERHMVILQGSQVATVLMMKDPITTEQLAGADAICTRRGFYRHFPLQDAPPTHRVEPLIALLKMGEGSFRERGLNVSPPVDDKPFFFQIARVFGSVKPELLETLSWNEEASRLLRGLMIAVSVLGAVLFFLPFALRRRLERHPGFWRGSAYFASIGLAFMLIEIPSIQRAILYLGHPSHATTVVLSSMLFGAGVGSWWAGRRPPPPAQWTTALLTVLALQNLAMSWVLHSTIGWAFAARAAVAFGLFGGMGLLMGFAFPLGMMHFGDGNKAWFWAVNGAASVTASVLSLGLAMELGYTNVVYAGVGLYALAGLLLAGARVVTEQPQRRNPARSHSPS